MVESQPSKLLVAGSIPVSRSSLRSRPCHFAASFGWQALRLSAVATKSRRWKLRLASLEACAPKPIGEGALAGHVVPVEGEATCVAVTPVEGKADLSAEAEANGLKPRRRPM